MNKQVLNFYKQTSQYTDAGIFKDYFKTLPDNINELKDLVCAQHIHKMRVFRTFDKQKVKQNFVWYNFLNDDLITASAMANEIFRLNPKGFIFNKKDEENLTITCRYVAVLFASILKAKGIPCRCRSGFAPYIYEDYNVDHWVNEYFSEKENRWIAIDVDVRDNTRTHNKKATLYDIGKFFETAPEIWLKVRQGKLENIEKYLKHSRYTGLDCFAHFLLLDFFALNNMELTYRHSPEFIFEENFKKLKEKDFKELDELAKLMLEPDKNLKTLQNIFKTNEKYRLIHGLQLNPYI